MWRLMLGRQNINRAIFLLSCLILITSTVAGGLYRVLRARDDPVLVHFSNLGNAFAARGDTKVAIESYKGLLAIRPAFPQIEFNLANTLVQDGKLQEAAEHYQRAIELKPDWADAHYNFANLLSRGNEIETAHLHYREAVRLRPEFPEAHYNWGVLLARRGQPDAAIREFQESIRLKPKDPESYFSLGLVFSQTGRPDEAIKTFTLGLQLAPRHANMNDSLAWILATSPNAELRNGAEALKLAQTANAESASKNPQHLDTLAAALAEVGRFDEAFETAQLAGEISSRIGNSVLASAIKARVSLYQSRQPYRDAQ